MPVKRRPKRKKVVVKKKKVIKGKGVKSFYKKNKKSINTGLGLGALAGLLYFGGSGSGNKKLTGISGGRGKDMQYYYK